MKAYIQPILRLKPILVGLALFGFMWVVVTEVNDTYMYYHDTSGFLCYDCAIPPNQEHLFLSFLLVIASLALLLKKTWSDAGAVILSGLSFYIFLFKDLWQSSENAEVTTFSAANLKLWWHDLEHWHLLQILLAGFLLCYSAFSIIRLIRGHRNPTMSNNSFNRSAG